jgi:hypothetical protein
MALRDPQVSGCRGAWYYSGMDRSAYPTRKLRLDERQQDADVGAMTPGERMSMVWQLTLQAWAFAGKLPDEPRLRRDVGRVVRRGG